MVTRFLFFFILLSSASAQAQTSHGSVPFSGKGLLPANPPEKDCHANLSETDDQVLGEFRGAVRGGLSDAQLAKMFASAFPAGSQNNDQKLLLASQVWRTIVDAKRANILEHPPAQMRPQLEILKAHGLKTTPVADALKNFDWASAVDPAVGGALLALYPESAPSIVKLSQPPLKRPVALGSTIVMPESFSADSAKRVLTVSQYGSCCACGSMISNGS